MRWEIRISGFGGQGIIFAGLIIGKAASLYDSKHAVQTQSYGPQARGGSCRSDIVISDQEIRYPRVGNFDALVALSQSAYDRFKRKFHQSGGVLIYDPSMVNVSDDDLSFFKMNHIRPFALNAIREAEILGKSICANMIMAGAVSELTGYVSRQALKKSIESALDGKKAILNLKAVERGFELGGEYEAE